MKSTQTVVVFPAPPASMPDRLFADFEITGRKRSSAFVASYGIQVIVVALLLTITLTTTAPVLIHKKCSAISLVAPTLSEPAPVRQPVTRISVPAVASPKLPEIAAPIPIPAPRTPRVERTVDLPAPPAPKPVLQPNVLAEVPAMPVAKPVHTGSFGDPNGVPVQPHTSATNRAPALAAVGSFGTPATGTGRPTGRGVATGAFGTQGGASGQTNKAVKSVDFSETAALAKAKTVEVKVSPIAPVAIQSKPAPVYTEEARRLHVEGDVVVQVVFSATGEIRIVGVVKGLGHGLDEAAVAATRQIRFTPAQRDGQFVDYPATIHVVFALS
jgi:TonB family protein